MWIFTPFLKETIWGGTRIAPFKSIACDKDDIGESWELSGVSGSESVVASGPDAGTTLPQLLSRYGSAILGERNWQRFGTRFPLLIKFIDARQDLSVQVHPDDAMAHRLGMENGKTEMWYVIAADKGARLANGFRDPVDPADYERLVGTGEIEQVLNYQSIKPGDVFFIPAGRVHSIGTGSLVAEIQQTSEATFRLYDYHRKGPDGKERELHTELAKEAIRFDDTQGTPLKYTLRPDLPVTVVKCQHFTVNVMELSEEVMRDYSELDSFVVLIVIEGSATLRCGADKVSDVPTEMTVKQGETVLISASAKGLTITPGAEGVRLLETWM